MENLLKIWILFVDAFNFIVLAAGLLFLILPMLFVTFFIERMLGDYEV